MIVADASVVTKWLLREELSDQALALLNGCSDRGEEIVCPHLLPFEVTNAVWKRVVRGSLTAADASAVLAAFLDIGLIALPQRREQSAAMHRRAFELTRDHSLRATYDAVYVALAEQLGTDLWTADLGLARTLSGLRFVRWIGTYGSSS